MMKKLAVTVFALSLAAFGCGSDSGEKKPDSGTDAKIDMAPKTDVNQPDQPIPSGPEAGAEVKLDLPIPVDQSAVDVSKQLDVQSIDHVQVTVDGGTVDANQPDKPAPVLDGGKIDVQPTEAQPPVIDGAKPVDGGATG
jgi:hypothetical protein